MKKFLYKSKIFIALFAVCASAFFICANSNVDENNYVEAANQYDIVSQESGILSAGTNMTEKFENLFVAVNFAGEQTNLSSVQGYGSTYELFDAMYNTGESSVNKYYNTLSNGILDLDTQIVNNNGSVFLVTLDNSRNYYSNYLYYDTATNNYVKNPEGYFDYMLVESDKASSYELGYYYFNDTVVAKVYDEGMSGLIDTNASDGIISKGYATQLANSNINYALIKNPMRDLREYQMASEVLESASSYIAANNLDSDNDDVLDIFSVGIISSTLAHSQKQEKNWGHLLWPHRNTIGLYNWGVGSYISAQWIASTGCSISDANTILNYFSTPATVSGLKFNNFFMDLYNLYEVNNQNAFDTMTMNNKTATHELGHVLGLDDLYSYESNSNSTVGAYSLMGYNHTQTTTFTTTWERQRLGWINENNLKEITKNGNYTLDDVSGLDGNDTICYRVDLGEDYYLYLEYRNSNQVGLVFDKHFGSYFYDPGQSGLLVYKVYTKAKAGNRYPSTKPIEIEVLHKDNYDDSLKEDCTLATMLANETLSYGNYEISVNSINGNLLSFNIESDDLMPAGEKITLADLGNNQLLYNYLLGLGGGTLDTTSLYNEIYLDIENMNLTSLDFLSLFDLNALEYINAANNIISTYQDLSSITTLKAVNYNMNNIDFDKLTLVQKQDSVSNYGIQQDINTYYSNDPIIFEYLYKSTDVYKITVDNALVSACTDFMPKYYSALSVGEHEIRVVSTTSYQYFYNKNFTYFTITENFSSIDSPYLIDYPNTQTFDKDLFFEIDGLDSFEITFVNPNLNVNTSGNFVVTFKIDDYTSYSYNVFYECVEQIDVRLNGDEYTKLYISDVYTENGVNIYIDDVLQSYMQDSSLLPNTYFVTYYSATVNDDVYTAGSVVSNIDSSNAAFFVVKYTIFNSQGFKFYKERYVEIKDGTILRTDIDERLYDALIREAQTDVLKISTFLDCTLLDLSYANLTTITDLKRFNFNNDFTLVLNNNNLSSVVDIDFLCQEITNIECIHLLFNDYEELDHTPLLNVNAQIIFGIQNIDYMISDITNKQGHFYVDDYISSYTMQTSQSYSISGNKIIFDNYGEQTITFTDIYGNNFEMSFVNIFVENKTVSYSYYAQYNAGDLVEIFGIDSSLCSVDFTNDTEKLTKIVGDQTLDIKITVLACNKNIVVSSMVAVFDDRKPNFVISGGDVVYVTSFEEYYQNYDSSLYKAVDEYDGEIKMTITEQQGESVLVIKYYAEDSSGNNITFIRNVYVGSISMDTEGLTFDEENDSYVKSVDFNNTFFFPFDIVNFNIDDFIITYNIEGHEDKKVYDINSGININFYGYFKTTFVVGSTFSHREYTFDSLHIFVNDYIAPQITANKVQINNFAGQEMEALDFKVTDNSTNTQLSFIDTECKNLKVSYEYYNSKNERIEAIAKGQVGDFTIKVIARDYANNSSFVTYNLTKVYEPMHVILDDKLNTAKYTVGDVIAIGLKSQNTYTPNPVYKVDWYVDGKLYKSVSMLTTTLDLDAGDYKIKACVYSEEELVFTDSFDLKINDLSFIQRYFWHFIGVAAGLLGLFVIYIVIKSIKNKYFY